MDGLMKLFDTELAKTSLSPEVREKVSSDVKNDLVLLVLELDDDHEVSVTVDEENITVQIGPRDLQFDLDGNWHSSGTMLPDFYNECRAKK